MTAAGALHRKATLASRKVIGIKDLAILQNTML